MDGKGRLLPLGQLSALTAIAGSEKYTPEERISSGVTALELWERRWEETHNVSEMWRRTVKGVDGFFYSAECTCSWDGEWVQGVEAALMLWWDHRTEELTAQTAQEVQGG